MRACVRACVCLRAEVWRAACFQVWGGGLAEAPAPAGAAAASQDMGQAATRTVLSALTTSSTGSGAMGAMLAAALCQGLLDGTLEEV